MSDKGDGHLKRRWPQMLLSSGNLALNGNVVLDLEASTLRLLLRQAYDLSVHRQPGDVEGWVHRVQVEVRAVQHIANVRGTDVK